MNPIRNPCLLFVLLPVLATDAVYAQVPSLITVDEFGNGTYQTAAGSSSLASRLAPDPTGGLMDWNVLIYDLPFLGTPGDVLMFDPLEPGEPVLDLLRFDGQGHLIFYSDNIDGFDAPGDTPGPPDPLLANLAFIEEQGAEGETQFGDYFPLVTDPGGDASGPTYRFISDVPDSGATTLPLMLAGLGGLAWLRQRSRGPREALPG